MRRDLSLSSKIKGYFDPAERSKSPFKPIALDRTAKVEPKSEAIRLSSIAISSESEIHSIPSSNLGQATIIAAHERGRRRIVKRDLGTPNEV